MITNIDDISSANPHWHSKVFSVCEYPYKRKTYSSLHAWLNERKMISLSGLRRTGKSVLLEQMQDEYVKKHLKGDTKRLFRFSFDLLTRGLKGV